MPVQGSVWSCVRLQQDQSKSNATEGSGDGKYSRGPRGLQQASRMDKKKTSKCLDSLLFVSLIQPLRTKARITCSHFGLARTKCQCFFARCVGVVPVEAHRVEPPETKGLPMVGLIQNDKAAVKGNGSRQCRDSSILPLASAKTLMKLGWIWSALFYSVFHPPRIYLLNNNPHFETLYFTDSKISVFLRVGSPQMSNYLLCYCCRSWNTRLERAQKIRLLQSMESTPSMSRCQHGRSVDGQPNGLV